jgi:hypothetical protein
VKTLYLAFGLIAIINKLLELGKRILERSDVINTPACDHNSNSKSNIHSNSNKYENNANI